MKGQMDDGDLVEFHSIAYDVQKMANEGRNLDLPSKAALVGKK